MRSQLKLALCAALAAIIIVGMVARSHALASAESDWDQIIALNKVQAAAFDKKDLDIVMSFYVDDEDAVFYEDTTPFQLVGTTALRKFDRDFFDNASRIHSTMEDIVVVSSGDLAVARYTAGVEWTDQEGHHDERGRFTQVLKKVNGKWLIWHEHFSVPFDPATGKAALFVR